MRCASRLSSGSVARGIKSKLERLDGEVVRPLGVERKEKRLA